MAVRSQTVSIYQHVSFELILLGTTCTLWPRACLAGSTQRRVFVRPISCGSRKSKCSSSAGCCCIPWSCVVVTCALGSAARLAHTRRVVPVRSRRMADCAVLTQTPSLPGLFWGYSEICGSGAEPLTAPSCTGTLRFNGSISLHAFNTRQCALQHYTHTIESLLGQAQCQQCIAALHGVARPYLLASAGISKVPHFYSSV